MAKVISDRLDIPDGPMQGYGDKMDPYYCMLEYLYKGKNETEQEQIRKDFEESFTYLLIAEQGKYTLPMDALKRLYNAEKESGIKGFCKVLLWAIPDLLD